MPLRSLTLKSQVAPLLKVVQNSRVEAKGDMGLVFDVTCRYWNNHVGRLCRPCALKKHKNSRTTTSSQLHLSKHPACATSRLRPCNLMPSVSMSSSYALPEFLHRAFLAWTKTKKKNPPWKLSASPAALGFGILIVSAFAGKWLPFAFSFPTGGRGRYWRFHCPCGEPAMCLWSLGKSGFGGKYLKAITLQSIESRLPFFYDRKWVCQSRAEAFHAQSLC